MATTNKLSSSCSSISSMKPNPSPRNSESKDPMRRSFSGNPFPKPSSILANSRGGFNPNTPANSPSGSVSNIFTFLFIVCAFGIKDVFFCLVPRKLWVLERKWMYHMFTFVGSKKNELKCFSQCSLEKELIVGS